MANPPAPTPPPFQPVPRFPSAPLTIEPLAVRVYTDLKRGKPVIVMTYRRRDMAEPAARRWGEEVQADLARAGYVVTDPGAAPRITRNAGKSTPARARFDCLIELPVDCPAVTAEALGEWAGIVRRVFVGVAGREGDGQ